MPVSVQPTGNCPHWIFRKTDGGWAEEIGLGSAQSVTIEKDTTEPEIVAQQHGSAFDSDLRVYQFDGARYRLTKCMDQSYRDPNDFDRVLDKPIITDIYCQP